MGSPAAAPRQGVGHGERLGQRQSEVKLSGGNLGRDEIAPVDLKAGGRILPMPRPASLIVPETYPSENN
jgi:hypothetical protein